MLLSFDVVQGDCNYENSATRAIVCVAWHSGNDDSSGRRVYINQITKMREAMLLNCMEWDTGVDADDGISSVLVYKSMR